MTDGDIAARFWQTLSNEEMHDILKRGWLNAEQCASLWHMTDRQGTPPLRVDVLLNYAEVLKHFPVGE